MACLRRYHRHLNENRKNMAWSNEEDNRLLDLVDAHGTSAARSAVLPPFPPFPSLCVSTCPHAVL